MRSRLGPMLVALLVGCGGEVLESTPDATPADADTDVGVDAPSDGAEPPVDGSTKPPPPPTPSDQVDLLVVVDNSISMGDKQQLLSRALPQLVRDLVAPPVDASGKPAWKRVASLHVGIITSSMGSHGTSACAPELSTPHNDDHGHLLPRTGEGGGTGWTVNSSGASSPAPCPAPIEASALSWSYDPTGAGRFVGAGGAAPMGTATSCVVQSASQDGCGYEETLESMYHFLVDPAPYADASVKCTFGASGDACGANKIDVLGVDGEILAQREAFLRPTSTVVVVVLSDEDDASLKPSGLNWLPWGYGKGQMAPGWAACAKVPDDFEPTTAAEFAQLHGSYGCFSCFEDPSDPNCATKWASDPLNHDVDSRNLRPIRQVQRFGYNFLHARQRYVDALTSPTVVDSAGKTAPNPLFASGRSPGNVIFAPIVGVPKFLVAGGDGLPKALSAADWDRIVGPIGKRDPHMIQSIAPRAGVAKYAGDRSIDTVNGGDRDVPDGDDLQYACIAPRVSTTKGFLCSTPDAKARNPVCNGMDDQPYFAAYPALRTLRVARALGDRAVVSSICDAEYSKAMTGLVKRLQPLLK